MQTQKFLSLSQEHTFHVSQSILQAFSRVGCSLLSRSSAFDSLISSGKKENQIIGINSSGIPEVFLLIWTNFS